MIFAEFKGSFFVLLILLQTYPEFEDGIGKWHMFPDHAK